MSLKLNFTRRNFTARRWAIAALAAAALAPAAWASADVFDQVPADKAMVVIRINDLDKTSQKIAKEAKDLALDQQQPQLADPLHSMEEALHISKGINKDGDVGVIILAPGAAGGFLYEWRGANKGDEVIVLVPTDDYQAFLSNFKYPQPDGDITEVNLNHPDQPVKVDLTDSDPSAYVAHWGGYAAISQYEENLKLEHKGIKLTGIDAREAKSSDAFIYLNMPAARPTMLEELDSVWQMMQASMPQMSATAAQKGIFSLYNSGLVRVIDDAKSMSLAVNLSTKGYNFNSNLVFDPQSKIGRWMAKMPNTRDGLMKGIPAGTYWTYGGFLAAPDVYRDIADTFEQAIKAQGADDPQIKQVIESIDNWKKAAAIIKGESFGIVAAKGKIGQESVLKVLVVVDCNAPTIATLERDSLARLGNAPAENGLTTTVTINQQAKEVGGVKLDDARVKFTADGTPEAQEDLKSFGKIFGSDGLRVAMGAVDDRTYLMSVATTDDFLTRAVAAALQHTDALAQTDGVKEVDAMLPPDRVAVAYVAVDNIVSSMRNYFGAMMGQFHLADNLPPIGIAVSTDGSSMQIDYAVPEFLVQSIVAAKMTAQQNNNGGGL